MYPRDTSNFCIDRHKIGTSVSTFLGFFHHKPKMPYKRKAFHITPSRGYVSFPSGTRRTRVRAGGVYTAHRTPRHRGRDTRMTQELKFHDVLFSDAVITTAGDVTATLNLIAQGVTESTRVGRKCTLKSFAWHFDMDLPEVDAAATPAGGDVVRVILFLDKQANGAALVVTDFLEINNYQSFNNLANSSRFRTLMDRSYDLNYASLASDGAAVVSQSDVVLHDSFYKDFVIPLEFNAAAGALTEIRSNNLCAILISKTGLAGFTSRIRIRFTDG